MSVDVLRCTRCLLPLREPRFYVQVVGRAIYHWHCAQEIAPRAAIRHVPTAVARTLLAAPHRVRLLQWGWTVEARDAWWGLFWERRDVRLSLYLCVVPFLPLRLVLGPRLRMPR